MSNMIYKFNQAGVAESIQLGKTGGHVTYEKLTKDGQFVFTTGAGTNPILLTPLSDADYASRTNTNIKDNTLVTAGYVKGLVQGMRTKRSVQTCTKKGGEVGADYFNPVTSPLLWATTDIARAVLADPIHRNLLGFGSYVPSDVLNDNDAAFVAMRKVFTAGTRILVKDQTRKWQNGVYVLTINSDKSRVYLARAEDMDVEDEVEGSYVYVEQGEFESTGWVGSIPASPASINDTTEPKLKSIDFAGAGNYTTADGTAGFTAITFDQFHGQGTINGDTMRGIDIKENKVFLSYETVSPAAGTALKAIPTNGELAILVTEGVTKTYVRRSLKDLFHDDFQLNPAKIHGAYDAGGKAFEVRIANGETTAGAAIEFGAMANGLYPANDVLLSAAADHFTVDFGGKTTAKFATADKGSDIKFTAGGTSSATGTGGDIILEAGDASTAGPASHAGKIVLRAGKEGNDQTGTVVVEGAALRLPVVDGSAAVLSADESTGAIRLNKALPNAVGVDTLQYWNGKEWVQVDGASYFIHDTPNSADSETKFDTWISTMGTAMAGNTVPAQHSNQLTFVAKSKEVMYAREDEVSITPHGPVKIEPKSNGKLGSVSIITPVALSGGDLASTGEFTVKTGDNTTSTKSGSKSGKITLITGDHQYVSGDIEIGTGGAIGSGSGVTGAQVGSVYISTGKPEVAGSIEGTVYVGVAKVGHVKNNVVVGDVGNTEHVTVSGKNVSIGEDATTTNITVGKKGTNTATSSPKLTMHGNDVVISSNDDTSTGAGGVTITGNTITLGASPTKNTVKIGHQGEFDASNNPTGDNGTVTDIKGKTVSLFTAGTLTIGSVKAGGNVVFDTKSGAGDTGGVITVSNPKYTQAVDNVLNALPNVEYVQKMIKDGKFGPGARRAKITKATSVANAKSVQIGTALPQGAMVTRVSLTVSTAFKWTNTAGAVSIVAAKSGTSAEAGGAGTTLLMSTEDNDIITPVGINDTRTYVMEWGAGRSADADQIFAVFPLGYTPESANEGDISILIEFVTA